MVCLRSFDVIFSMKSFHKQQIFLTLETPDIQHSISLNPGRERPTPAQSSTPDLVPARYSGHSPALPHFAASATRTNLGMSKRTVMDAMVIYGASPEKTLPPAL